MAVRPHASREAEAVRWSPAASPPCCCSSSRPEPAPARAASSRGPAISTDNDNPGGKGLGKKERQRQLRAEPLAREAETERHARRNRLVQLGSAAVFLAVCALAVLMVVSLLDSGSGSGIEGAGAVDSELAGIPQSGTVLGKPGSG
jgi:hypothetical protein